MLGGQLGNAVDEPGLIAIPEAAPQTMDPDVRNSLEAIANLIYLIRHSVHGQAATIAYADLADERVKAIALHFDHQRVVAP
jgi:hypothetical protein